MKKRDFWTGVLTGALVVSVAGTGLAFGFLYGLQSRGGVLSDSEHMRKVQVLEELIDGEYLGEIRDEDLAEGMYKGLVYGLGDPYSCYYTAEEYEEETTSSQGSYTGIGVLIEDHPDGGLLIAECYEGSPGEEAGLLAGDIITAIDGTDITNLEKEKAVEMIRSSQSGSILLAIRREGSEEPLEIQVDVRNVEVPAVFYEMLGEKVGYIRISEFTGVAVHQYQEAFQSLKDQGMEKMMVDLRDNPGGLLDSVCGILEEILPEGLIVYTEDKNGNREEIRCEGLHPLDLPLVVLVNGDSASASEIFAGAVQDYGIGTIVGTTTYGKGVVQGISRLSDGSAVKLTISQYFTPDGNSIHEKGIVPDVEVQLDASLQNKAEISHEEDDQLQEGLKILGED